jgi:CRP-like cAMP-binding protein
MGDGPARSRVICIPFEMIWPLLSVADMSLCRLYSTGHTKPGWFYMSVSKGTGGRDIDPRANRLLRGLPDAELNRIRPALEPVHLPRPTELEGANEEIRFVYFPTTGVASIVAIDENGESVDTAMIGREGMTGLAVFLGTGQSPVRTIVQVPMTGIRMESAALREELGRAGTLVTLLQRHTQLVMITMAQLILCNRLHRLDQRAARWLLQVDDRVDEAPFRVTQEFLAQMIGVQRPALSVAMRQFKDAGLVRYARGQISIADRDGLLARSCGCTKVIAAEARRLDKILERADGED